MGDLCNDPAEYGLEESKPVPWDWGWVWSPKTSSGLSDPTCSGRETPRTRTIGRVWDRNCCLDGWWQSRQDGGKEKERQERMAVGQTKLDLDTDTKQKGVFYLSLLFLDLAAIRVCPMVKLLSLSSMSSGCGLCWTCASVPCDWADFLPSWLRLQSPC